jgi:hypothetical protein
MADSTDVDFDSLAAKLTDPTTPMPKPTDVATGAGAAARGRALMVRQYGSEAALDAVLRRAGRTRLGEQPKGASPTVRGRLPEADFAAFKRLEEHTGKNQSELVREAVQLLLAEHKIGA